METSKGQLSLVWGFGMKPGNEATAAVAPQNSVSKKPAARVVVVTPDASGGPNSFLQLKTTLHQNVLARMDLAASEAM
jgi:hypothetical protein